jgi:hypothetical protein
MRRGILQACALNRTLPHDPRCQAHKHLSQIRSAQLPGHLHFLLDPETGIEAVQGHAIISEEAARRIHIRLHRREPNCRHGRYAMISDRQNWVTFEIRSVARLPRGLNCARRASPSKPRSRGQINMRSDRSDVPTGGNSDGNSRRVNAIRRNRGCPFLREDVLPSSWREGLRAGAF